MRPAEKKRPRTSQRSVASRKYLKCYFNPTESWFGPFKPEGHGLGAHTGTPTPNPQSPAHAVV